MEGQNNVYQGQGSMGQQQPPMSTGTVPMNATPVQPTPVVKKPRPKWVVPVIIASAAAVILAVVAIFALPAVFKVNYSEAYGISKEMADSVSEFGTSRSCMNATSRVGNSSYSSSSYNEYIATCQSAIATVRTETEKLKNTPAVKRDKEISALFEAYLVQYDAIVPVYEKALPVYEAWHNFSATYGNIKDNFAKTTDAELKQSFDYLINSGVDALATYGNATLKLAMDCLQALRDFNAYTRIDSHRTELRNIYNDKLRIANDYAVKNKPTMKDLLGVDLETIKNTMPADFENLRVAIKERYQENYTGEVKCSELLGVVYCN